MEHVNAFIYWALAIHLGKLVKAIVTINPDNNELQNFSAARHAECILPPLRATGTLGGAGTVGQHAFLETKVFKSLGKGLKQIGEAVYKANVLKQEEIKLKGEEDKKKKNRIKDMHPSISNMILMASAVEPDIQGKYADSFKAFYNSKNHGYADMELHHQFEVKGIHNVGFAEGKVLALWSGLLKRSNPMGPSNCTPFAFRELQPANMNQKSRSLICIMINQKGGLAQSAEEIKTKAKQDVAAPKSYTEMLFQLKAFVALIEILFGDDSVAAKKLEKFVRLIKAQSIVYKARAALDDFFPCKVLWSVCTCFQLFLDNCTHAEEREDVDDSIVNFNKDHRDIILGQFGSTLPPCFKDVRTNDPDTKTKKGKKSKKHKKEEAKEKRKECKEGAADLGVKNKHQCVDFKMKEEEQWSTFVGSNLKEQAKLNKTFMCGCWHTRGHCFLDCNNKASHVPCSEIPADVKQAHMQWMKKVC